MTHRSSNATIRILNKSRSPGPTVTINVGQMSGTSKQQLEWEYACIVSMTKGFLFISLLAMLPTLA